MRYMVYALLLLGMVFPAQARQRHVIVPVCDNKDVMRPCAYQPNFLSGVRSIRISMKRERHARVRTGHRTIETGIVEHPAGCPRSAFCGCGASVRIFGHSVRELWLAANWFRFPRTSPAPGMVAVRRHHVMVLEADLGGGMWQVYDANSGAHATRVHARSIAEYVIVNPRS